MKKIIEHPICKECEDRPVMTLKEEHHDAKLFIYICPGGHENTYHYKFPIETTDMGKTWKTVEE